MEDRIDLQARRVQADVMCVDFITKALSDSIMLGDVDDEMVVDVPEFSRAERTCSQMDVNG